MSLLCETASLLWVHHASVHTRELHRTSVHSLVVTVVCALQEGAPFICAQQRDALWVYARRCCDCVLCTAGRCTIHLCTTVLWLFCALLEGAPCVCARLLWLWSVHCRKVHRVSVHSLVVTVVCALQEGAPCVCARLLDCSVHCRKVHRVSVHSCVVTVFCALQEGAPCVCAQLCCDCVLCTAGRCRFVVRTPPVMYTTMCHVTIPASAATTRADASWDRISVRNTVSAAATVSLEYTLCCHIPMSHCTPCEICILQHVWGSLCCVQQGSVWCGP